MVDRLVNSEANARRIANVENCFGMSGLPLAIPGRVLVGEGVLTKMCRKKPKPRQVFLFNDILVYGSIIINKKKYNRQHIIPLENIKLENLEDEGELRNGWLIKTPNKSFAVYAATATEKVEWMAHINKCVEELILRTGSRPAEEHAAVWVPDNASEKCMHCKKTQFTVINRRHHCRNCGLVVCGACSKNRFLIPSQSSKPVRVCGTCYSSLGKNRVSIRQPTRPLSEDSVKNSQETTTNTIGTTPPITGTETRAFNERAVDVDVTKESVDDNSNESSDSDIEDKDYSGKTLGSEEINKSLENLAIDDDVKPTFYRGIDPDKDNNNASARNSV